MIILDYFVDFVYILSTGSGCYLGSNCYILGDTTVSNELAIGPNSYVINQVTNRTTKGVLLCGVPAVTPVNWTHDKQDSLDKIQYSQE